MALDGSAVANGVYCNLKIFRALAGRRPGFIPDVLNSRDAHTHTHTHFAGGASKDGCCWTIGWSMSVTDV